MKGTSQANSLTTLMPEMISLSTRSLSSFFKTLPQDLLQGHLLDAREDGGEGSTTGDALSDASSSSDKSSVLAEL